MEFIRSLFCKKQPIEEKKARVSAEVHADKNRFTREMMRWEVSAKDISKRSDKLHKAIKNSVAFKLAVVSGGKKRGLKI